jgi:hypothetical protein
MSVTSYQKNVAREEEINGKRQWREEGILIKYN